MAEGVATLKYRVLQVDFMGIPDRGQTWADRTVEVVVMQEEELDNWIYPENKVGMAVM